MADDLGSQLINRAERLFNSTERKNFETEWRLISKYIAPNHTGLFNAANATATNDGGSNDSTAPGSKRTRDIYDTTAIDANLTLSSNIFTAAASPNSDWAMVSFDNDGLNNDRESILWLQTLNAALTNTMNKSNLYMELAKSFPLYTALGNAMTLVDVDKKNGGACCKSLHIANTVWEEDEYGYVNAVFHKTIYTARQAYDLWGMNACKDIDKIVKESPDKDLKYLMAIYPRQPEEIEPSSTGEAAGEFRPWASVFVCLETSEVANEDGYYEFPCAPARYDVIPGERYGRGPGSIALPDARSANVLQKEILTAVPMLNRPMLKINPTDMLGSLNLVPGGILPTRNMDSIQPLQLGQSPQSAEDALIRVQQQIQKTFLIDKLMLPPRTEIGEMSAAEIRQRAEEIQRVFGPNLARLETEYLEKIVIRFLKIILRSGIVKQAPPQVLQLGLPVNVKFINRFSRVQQLEGVSNLLGYLAEIGQMAQLDPNVIDNIDLDQAALYVGKTRAVLESIMRPDEEIKAMRDSRAKQQQQQQALQSGVALADIHSKTKG